MLDLYFEFCSHNNTDFHKTNWSLVRITLFPAIILGYERTY